MRRTKKLLEATATIKKYGLQAHRIGFNSLSSSDEHYQLLEENNYFWSSKTQQWEKAQNAEPPTEKIRIRITTGGDWLSNSNLLERLEKAFEAIKLLQISKSKIYNQRPPNQLDSAIYYEFMDELKGGK
jgi:hypothetical protein